MCDDLDTFSEVSPKELVYAVLGLVEDHVNVQTDRIYTGTGSDYLDCLLGVGGFESFGPIDTEQPKTVYVDYPPDDCSICPRTNGLHMWGINHCRHCDQPWPEEYRSKK